MVESRFSGNFYPENVSLPRNLLGSQNPLWEEYSSMFENDRCTFFYLDNEKLNNRVVGFIVRGSGQNSGVDRILLAPLTTKKIMGARQILMELYQEGVFEGKLAISLVDVRRQFDELGLNRFQAITGGRAFQYGSAISGLLDVLSDVQWRGIAIETLSAKRARSLDRQWFC
jgi:hypothetical protein